MEGYGGMWSDTFVPLVRAFLLLLFLMPPADGMIQLTERIVRWLPVRYNNLGTIVLFLATVGVAYCICWRADFDFYEHLGAQFTKQEGWLFTAILMSLGTTGLRQKFEVLQLIPLSLWGGIGSAVRRAIDKDGR